MGWRSFSGNGVLGDIFWIKRRAGGSSTGASAGTATVHTMPDPNAVPNSDPPPRPDLDVSMATAVLADIEASPSPYHAVARASVLLHAAGFTKVNHHATLPTTTGGYYLARGGALVAWVTPSRSEAAGFCVVGAHTDSPNLRIRTNADVSSAGWAQVGVETYGGLLLNSWLDRDLGLAGRVTVRTADGPVERLVRDGRPVLRIPQLAIHLDREIGDKGLKLNAQDHLTPLWATGESGDGDVLEYIAGLAEVTTDDLLAWELMAFDTQPPAIVGRDDDLVASARIDNQLSCFAGIHALVATASGSPSRVPVLALYDHEEIGSTSSTGAAGGFLAGVLERISASLGIDRVGHLEGLSGSIVVSADGAHATHPNYADRHEPNHHIAVNGGVVIKRNANQRYATDAESEGFIRSVCADAGVPVQTYIHRNDLPCGSTIGPVTAAELAVPTVDLGAPQLAMHSIRELAGTEDIDHLARALAAAWQAG